MKRFIIAGALLFFGSTSFASAKMESIKKMEEEKDESKMSGEDEPEITKPLKIHFKSQEYFFQASPNDGFFASEKLALLIFENKQFTATGSYNSFKPKFEGHEKIKKIMEKATELFVDVYYPDGTVIYDPKKGGINSDEAYTVDGFADTSWWKN